MTHNSRISKSIGSIVMVFLAVSLGPLPFAAPACAVTPADADAAFAALNKVYWDPDIKFFRKEEHGPEKADFWFEARSGTR